MGDPAAPVPVEVHSWVDEHADFLYRYAYSRLLDRSLAEDLVQETFLAALGAWRRFSGRSSVRTWLVSILKNKIVDHFRRVSRIDRDSLDTFYVSEAQAHFDEGGHWRLDAPTTPVTWPPSQQARLEQEEFWRQLEECVKHLPPRVREVFVLRQMEDFETQEVCQLLNISRQNLWSVMHRARMALRDCLDANWFRLHAGA